MTDLKQLNKTYCDHEIYWYARGYYDGREKGYRVSELHVPNQHQDVYNDGYDRGVSDHCEMESICDGCYDPIEPDEPIVRFDDVVFHERCCE